MDAGHLITAPYDPATPFASRENSRDGYPGVVHPLDLTTISVPADRGMRQCLRDLGIRTMRLLSNNRRKLVGIEGYGLSVSEWLPLEIPATDSTRKYLTTKKNKLGHKLSSV